MTRSTKTLLAIGVVIAPVVGLFIAIWAISGWKTLLFVSGVAVAGLFVALAWGWAIDTLRTP